MPGAGRTPGHLEAALAVVRKLYGTSDDIARDRPVLAAALYNHAGRLRRPGRMDEAAALLTESGQHHEALAAADPASYQVRRIDVLVRVGLTSETVGDAVVPVRRSPLPSLPQ